jgi:ABC-type dipeptide/oligopeptide/nickel transport system permease component
MLGYIVRRVLATIPVMAIVALFVFSLLYIAPGDPAVVIAGDQASPEDIERIRKGLGLDRRSSCGLRSGRCTVRGDLGSPCSRGCR